MRVGFQDADFEALAALWARALPDRYRVTPNLLRANTVDSPVFDWGASYIEMGESGPEAFVAIKRSANPMLFSGPDPDCAHVSALVFEDPGQAIDLVAEVKHVLRERGVYRLAFGQDARHFFPGCPNDCHALRDFLIIEGFEEGLEVCDLERDLSNYEPPAGCVETLKRAKVGPIGEQHVPALHALLEREFPGRWACDLKACIDQEGSSEGVFGLFSGDEVQGFALTQREGQSLPIGGGVWHQALGEQWGSLGPIGVAKSIRGQGQGNALLASALLALKSAGVRQCIIDWTTLVEFYGRHGFVPTRNYRQFVLKLTTN